MSSTKNLQNQIKNALITSNDNAVKQKAGFLQTASNSSSSKTTVNEAISNLVTNNISDTVTNSLVAILDNAQNNKIIIEGPVECSKENPYIFSNIQNMLTSQIVDTITKALTGTTISNVMETSSDISNKNVGDQEGEGIGSVISAFFEGLAGLISGTVMAIGAIVIVLAIIVGCIIYKYISI